MLGPVVFLGGGEEALFVGVENIYVLYITETCKIRALVAAEQQQKCIDTYIC